MLIAYLFVRSRREALVRGPSDSAETRATSSIEVTPVADLEQAVLAKGEHPLLAGDLGDFGLGARWSTVSSLTGRSSPSPRRGRCGRGSRCWLQRAQPTGS